MKFGIEIDADSDQAIAGLKKVTAEINAAQAAEQRAEQLKQKQAKWDKERATFAQQHRKEREASLSVEERLSRLKQQEALNEERLARATASGNQYRRSALLLRQQQLGTQRTELQLAMQAGFAKASDGSGRAGMGALGDVASAGFFGSFLAQVPFIAQIASKLVSIPGLIASAIIGLGGNYLSQASKAGERRRMSLATGFTPEELKVINRSSVVDEFEPQAIYGMAERLRGHQGEALGGSKEMAEAFKAFGIEHGELARSDGSDLFVKIAKSMEKGTLTAQQYAAAIKLLGREFRSLMPALRAGLGSELDRASSDSGYDAAMLDANRRIQRTRANTAGAMKKGEGWLARLMHRGIGGAAMLSAILNNDKASFDEVAMATQAPELGDRGEGAVERAQASLMQAQTSRKDDEKLAQELAKKNAFALGSPSQRADMLRKQIAENIKKLKGIKNPLQRQELTSQIIDDQEALSKAGGEMNWQRPDTDRLARMGVFVGGGAQAYSMLGINLQKDVIKELQQIKREVHDLRQTVRHNETF